MHALGGQVGARVQGTEGAHAAGSRPSGPDRPGAIRSIETREKRTEEEKAYRVKSPVGRQKYSMVWIKPL